MIKSVKIRLFPTKEQEVLMFKSVGIARLAYNFGLAKWEELYKLGIKPNGRMVRKEFNKLKQKEEYSFIKQASAKVTQQSFIDLQTAYDNFFKGLAQYPRFKTKKRSKKSFYVRYDAISFKSGKVNMEKIGKVRCKTNYNIPILAKYINPRCHYDGRYWYITLGFEVNENQVELNKDLSIGIDLGIKDLAIVSSIEKPIKNINKSKKVSKLKKKLKRLQKQVSRKYEMNKQDGKFIKTSNIKKLEKEIVLIHRKLSNIRNNHIHQSTNKIVKLYPYRIVMEDINVKGLMKNKHLAEKIAEQGFYEFIRQIKYKCEFNGIEFVQADRFFPSSKTCSCCGSIKKDLKLSDRVYICDECGLEIDRDRNASINLGKYKLA